MSSGPSFSMIFIVVIVIVVVLVGILRTLLMGKRNSTNLGGNPPAVRISKCPQCNAGLSATDENCPSCGLRVGI